MLRSERQQLPLAILGCVVHRLPVAVARTRGIGHVHPRIAIGIRPGYVHVVYRHAEDFRHDDRHAGVGRLALSFQYRGGRAPPLRSSTAVARFAAARHRTCIIPDRAATWLTSHAGRQRSAICSVRGERSHRRRGRRNIVVDESPAVSNFSAGTLADPCPVGALPCPRISWAKPACSPPSHDSPPSWLRCRPHRLHVVIGVRWCQIRLTGMNGSRAGTSRIPRYPRLPSSTVR